MLHKVSGALTYNEIGKVRLVGGVRPNEPPSPMMNCMNGEGFIHRIAGRRRLQCEGMNPMNLS